MASTKVIFVDNCNILASISMGVKVNLSKIADQDIVHSISNIGETDRVPQKGTFVSLYKRCYEVVGIVYQYNDIDAIEKNDIFSNEYSLIIAVFLNETN